MTLGEIIKKYRNEHDLSMDSFSEKSGISKAYISLLEKNKHPKTGKPIAPSIQCIKQAASGMDMDFNDLFGMLDGNVSLEDYRQENDVDIKTEKCTGIGKILKEFRISSGISVKEISDILVSKGYKASESTIYSWENENSQPTPGAFLVMCSTYQIKNVLDTFGYNGYNEDGSIQLNLKEIEHIEKYRSLDPYGQETVSYILNRECERVSSLHEKDRQIAGLERSINQSTATLRIYTYMRKIASAGKGFYFEDIPTDTIEAPYHEDADFIIGVNGDSMEPTYSDGDMVYVQKCQIVNTGEIGIFILNNECLIKEAGKDGLISHNPKYSLIAGSENILCVGRVLGKVTFDNKFL